MNDVIAFTAEECGISRKKVLFIIRDFEKKLRKSISNPVETGLTIYLHGFFRFKFKLVKYKKRLDKDTTRQKDLDILEILNYLEKDE